MIDTVNIENIRNDYLDPTLSILEMTKKYQITHQSIYRHCKDLQSQRRDNQIARKISLRIFYSMGTPIDDLIGIFNYSEATIKTLCAGLYKTRVFHIKYSQFMILRELGIKSYILEKIFTRKISDNTRASRKILMDSPTLSLEYKHIREICFCTINELKDFLDKYTENIYLVLETISAFNKFYQNLLKLPLDSLNSISSFKEMKLHEKSNLINEWLDQHQEYKTVLVL